MRTDKCEGNFPAFSYPCSSVQSVAKTSYLPFVTFVNFCSKLFSSILLSSCPRGICCQSSIKFDRLRPFLVIRRVFVIDFPFFWVFEFDQVRRSSTDFESLQSSQAPLCECLPTPHRLDHTHSEQNRDWLRASRCLSRFCSSVKQRTARNSPQ